MDNLEPDQPPTSHPPFLLGETLVDPSRLRFERGDASERIEARVMEVLVVLARNSGRVVSRQTLEQEVWSDRVVTENAVSNAIRKLRRALNDNPQMPQVIETIAKRGYRLKIAPVDVAEDSPPQEAVEADSGRDGWERRWLSLGILLTLAVVSLLYWWLEKEPANTEFETETAVSVAVIPLDVLGGDSSQVYFAEGITLDLITELSRIPGLLVIAPGTMFSFRGAKGDDRAIASELGVQYLIRGGVQRIDDQIRINVRVLDAGRAETLWAERFLANTSSLFQIQDEVVRGIAKALPARLALSEQPLRGNAVTRSIAAYDEFLRGQERYGRRNPDDNRIAQRHFEEAIALDPAFARAHAALALTYGRLAVDGWAADPEASLSTAISYADKAASIDPSLPQIHFVRAQVELFRGQHERAAEAVATAIEFDPNYADAYALLAWILHYAGRPVNAEKALNQALTRNPHSSASYCEIAGEIYFSVRRYSEAAKEFQAALERNPAHMRARLWLAATLEKLGQHDEAAWQVQELLAINPEFSRSRLSFAFPLKDPRQLDTLVDVLDRLRLPK